MSKKGIHRRSFLARSAVSGLGLTVLGAEGRASASYQGNDLTVPRKQLGSTGETVPVLLMGCLQKFDPRYDRKLHRAFGMGVDYLDTAQGYAQGQSHKTLAPFLKQVGRENIWVTSKVNLRGSPSVSAYRSNLDTCLEDLETDYLDLFFMHAVQKVEELRPEFIKMGEDLKSAGKTRFFGFSCHHGTVPELLEKAAEVGGIDAIMFRYNFRRYGDLKLNKAIDSAKKAGIGLIAMKVMASVPPEEEQVVGFQSRDFTLEQAKLKAVWADERIDAAVSTMTNMQQLQDNAVAAASPMNLAMGDFTQLQRLASQTAELHCHGCVENCESRVEGNLRIADTLRYLMYHDSYGETELARSKYQSLSHSERDFAELDLSGATSSCPQGIDIASRLDRARRELSV